MAKILSYRESAIAGIQNLIDHIKNPIDFGIARETRFKTIIIGRQKCLDALFDLLETTKLKEEYVKNVSKALDKLNEEVLKIISYQFKIPTDKEISDIESNGGKIISVDEILGNIADAKKIANTMYSTIKKIKDRLNKNTENLVDENVQRKKHILEKFIKENVKYQY